MEPIQARWDFKDVASGAKSGIITDIGEGACVLRTSEAIEHQREVRVILPIGNRNVYATFVGKVSRREDKLETWPDDSITLYRYTLEMASGARRGAEPVEVRVPVVNRR